MRFLSKFFSLRSQSVRQASALLAVTAVLSNVLGFARDIVFSRLIPFNELSVYYASFRIADFVFNILIVSAISSAIIPVLTELNSHNRPERSQEVTNQLLTWATLALAILLSILWLAAPALVRHIVPGYSEGDIALTIRLSRIVLLQTLFFSWSYIVGGLLNAQRRFTTFALAPLVYNLALIIGGFLAARTSVAALTYSVVLGAFLHLSLQLVEAYRIGYRPHIRFTSGSELRAILQLMWPRSVGQGAAQALQVAYTSLASLLQKDALTIFTFMNNLQTTPTVVIANSLASAYFPSLSAHIATGNRPECDRLVTKASRLTLFMMLPLVALGLILRAQIVRLYIGTGHGTTWTETGIAVRTFGVFLFAMVPYGLVAVLTRLFYARRDSRSPMWITIFSSLAGIVFAYAGIHLYHGDVSTLAGAEVLVSVIQCTLYIWLLHKKHYADLNLPELIPSTGRYLIGSILAAGAAWCSLYLVDLIYGVIPYLSTGRIIGLLIQGVIAAIAGLLAYLGYSYLSCKEELQWIRLIR